MPSASDDAEQNFNPRSPHGERRTATVRHKWLDKYFNPRSPHGERLFGGIAFGSKFAFQPTLPARGATAALRRVSL